ncbi:Arginase family [seawater metagenome]|uniref:Arginase family n=1 Tax=seawater metagenome TaxID=1561972 RepID=A0A5E8CLY1_9ZZZZ
MNYRNVLCLPWRGGYSTNFGVEKGPDEILKLIKKNNLRVKKINHNNLSNEKYHETVFLERKNSKEFNTLVIGGDHSIAIGSIFGSMSLTEKKVGVIWIDAHPDINTIDASSTKRKHGMPLSFITGIESSWNWTSNLKKLEFEDLHYWGIRDIDNFEKKLIKDKNLNPDHNLESIIQVAKQYDYLHISLDIDGLDPLYTPSTGTPVPNGLSLQELEIFFKEISTVKNIAIDIVEYNPSLGNDVEKMKTKQSIQTLINFI